jgi:hypothetical protein
MKFAIIGTILGDYLMFYTINKSSKINLPIALIHLAPFFHYFNKKIKMGAIFGIYWNFNSNNLFYLETSTAYFFNNSYICSNFSLLIIKDLIIIIFLFVSNKKFSFFSTFFLIMATY